LQNEGLGSIDRFKQNCLKSKNRFKQVGGKAIEIKLSGQFYLKLIIRP